MGVDNIGPTESPRRPPEEDLRTHRAERKGRVRPAGDPGEDRWVRGEAKKEPPREEDEEEPQAEMDEEAAGETGEADPQPEGRKGRPFDQQA